MQQKLFYIANIRLPTEKAHGVQIMKMCEAFFDIGIDVELVIPRRINIIKEDPFLYYGIKNNFKIKRIPSFDLVRFGRAGFFIQRLSFSLIVFFYIFFHKHSIIYSRDEFSLYLLTFLNKKKIFWEVHTKKINFVINRLIKRNIKIISISNGLKDLYVKNGANKENILVAHDGVDLSDFDINFSKFAIRENFKLPKNKKIISYVGKYKTMGAGKGVDELIYAFSEVLKKIPSAFLLLVGINQSEFNDINVVFEKLRIANENYKVVFHVKQKEVPYYLKASDILVMNYPKTEHYEKFMSPLKMFEYMASGVPIITSDLMSIREVLSEKNAYFFLPDDSKNLAHVIMSALSDADESQKKSENAKLKSLNYTWKKRALNIFDFIETNVN